MCTLIAFALVNDSLLFNPVDSVLLIFHCFICQLCRPLYKITLLCQFRAQKVHRTDAYRMWIENHLGTIERILDLSLHYFVGV